MLNIPVISTISFVLIFFPSFLIGYLRGWKSSLFISIVVLGLMGSFLGLALGLYESVWWPMFKGMFVDKAGGAGNLEAFMDIAKPTVIGIILMITTPIAYGLAILVHLPLRDKLKRSLYPTVTRSSNKQEEYKVVRTRVVTQRVLGATISGTTGLFAASTVATGLESISTNTSSGTFLSGITRSLSNVYSFGQGGYDKDYQLAYEFLPETVDPVIQAGFNALSNIDQNSLNSLATNLAVFSDPAYQDELLKLSQSGDAFVAILKTLDQGINDKLQLWNQTGDASSNGISNTFFNDLENTISNISLGLHLGSDVVETIIDYLDSKLASFETITDENGNVIEEGSTWYKNWDNIIQQIKNAEDFLKSLQEQLAQAQTELENLKIDLVKLNSELKTMQQQLVDLNGPVSNTKSIAWAQDDFNKKSAITTSLSNTYNNYLQTVYNPSKQELDRLKGILDAKIDELDIKNSELASAQQQLTILQRNKTQIQGTISALQNELTSNTKRITAATSEKSTEDAKVANLTNATIPGIEGRITALDNEKNTLTSANSTLSSEMMILQNEINQLNTQINVETDPTIKNTLIQQRDSKVTIRQGKQNTYETNLARIKVIDGSLANENRLLGTANSDLQAARNKSANLQNEINSLNNRNNTITTSELPTQTTLLTETEKQIGETNSLIAKKNGEVGVAQAEVRAAQTEYDNWIATDYHTKEMTNNQNKQNYDNALNAQNAAQAELNNRTSTKNTLEGGIAVQGSIAYKQWEISNKETDITNKNTQIYTLKVDISNQEDVIVKLNEPATGEPYLKELMERNKMLYEANVARYNELIRQLLSS